LKEKAEKYLEKGKTNEAIPLLEKTIELYPRQKGDSSAYSLLASIYRKSKDTEKEREVLRKWARNTDEASDALLRLLELDTSDPKGLQKNASTFLEINPLTPQPYRALALADEKLGNPQPAIQSYETVLKLDPADPADVHYRLAKLFEKDNRDQAKRHVLLALEEAPRFRDAHRLLLQLEDSAEKTDQKPKTKSEKPAGFE
jgi:tetratricopeptide (TPR) repeat protein